MLGPDYLDHLPEELVKLWQQVEEDILQDVARRIGKMGTLTPTADWQLWRREQIRLCQREVLATLAKYSGKSTAELRRIFQQAAAEALADDDRLYRSAGLDPPDPNTDQALLNLLNAGYQQTAGSWQNLTATTAQTVTGQFEAALDRAWLQVASGAFDYNTSIRRAVNDLARNMAGVTYPTGHRDSLEVAVRRAVLTGVNQTAGKLQIARMEEMGWAFVETSAHAGARPEHAAWQGRQFHRGGAVTYRGRHYPDFEKATGYGTGAGLCGWNCRHGFFAIDPDLDPLPAYTEEELAALDAKTIEYQGRMYSAYEISQKQRALERKVRAAKKVFLAEDAAGLDTTRSAVKLKAARQDLARFVRDTGGREDPARTFVQGFGRSQAGRATAQAKMQQTITPTTATFSGTAGISKNFADGMSDVLKHSSHLEVKNIYARYQDELKCIDNQHRKGAYFSASEGGIHFNETSAASGSSYQKPYQVAFHEFGHNIDWLAGGKNNLVYVSNQMYNGNRLGDVIKSDYQVFKRSMGAKTNADLIAMLKAENMPLTECGNISDILEFCMNKSYPLGVGHGVSYHKRNGATEKEFFAEVLDSAASNEPSFHQMKRLFPNAVNWVLDIVRGVIK